eukprot:1084696-Karenia_brevis.AAC.1
MQHLLDSGGSISAHKSRLFATSISLRQWLATYKWAPIGSLINVSHSFRDLGSTLFSTLAVSTSLSAG